MIDIDGMIGRLMNLMQDAHLAVGLDCSSKYRITEVLLRHNLRAAEREEDASRLDALQTLHIKARVALERVAQSCAMLGKAGGSSTMRSYILSLASRYLNASSQNAA